MAIGKFTPRPAVVRGSLYFFIGDVGFSSKKAAICAASAAESHRLDLIDTLTEQRTVALARMRANARNVEAFAAAAKVEAELAFQIRQIRRENGKAVRHV